MPSKPRRRLQLDERRAQLLEAGLRLFQEHPYDEVSIEEIAQAVGVSKGLLYHYFGGKRALYVACVELAAERMKAAVVPDPALPPVAQAHSMVSAFLDFVRDHAGVMRTLLHGGLGTDPEVAAILHDTRTHFARQFLDSAQVHGDHPVFELAARTYVGAVEAASVAWLDDPRLDRDDVVRTLLAGLHGFMLAAAGIDPLAGVDAAIAAEALAAESPAQ